MSILITILSVIAGIIAFVLVVALLTKKEFELQKQIVINKPKAAVFNYLKLIKNQEYYSVWVMKDPNIKIIYTGTDGTAGFISSWTSDDKNVGIGEQEIIKINEGESIMMWRYVLKNHLKPLIMLIQRQQQLMIHKQK